MRQRRVAWVLWALTRLWLGQNRQTVDGLLAKAIQHETDHLEGVLFIDRISESSKKQVDIELEDFEIDFKSRRDTGEIPDDETILKRLGEIEARYCQ